MKSLGTNEETREGDVLLPYDDQPINENESQPTTSVFPTNGNNYSNLIHKITM
jgi:hypothetical protein